MLPSSQDVFFEVHHENVVKYDVYLDILVYIYIYICIACGVNSYNNIYFSRKAQNPRHPAKPVIHSYKTAANIRV